MVLVYGANFDDPAVKACVQAEPTLKATDKQPTDEELRASLERVLAGKAQWPAEPDAKDRGWRAPASCESNTMAFNCGSSAEHVVKVLRVRNALGVSAPYVVNRPEIWGVSPHRAPPGAAVTVWGVNLGQSTNHMYSRFGLINEQGKIVAILTGYWPSQNQTSYRVQEVRFYRSLILPADLAPGKYQLYCWNGYGDVGWSEAGHALTVVATARPPKVVKLAAFGAAGDGITDDTPAFEKALAACAAGGGGQVQVGVGRFEITHPLALPEGVSLVGLSPQASIIEACGYAAFTGTWPDEVMTRPAGYDPATYKPTGWGIDWVREKFFVDRAPMVWIKSRSAVENLTLDATHALRIRAIVLIAMPAPGTSVSPTVLNCRLLADHAGIYADWPTYWYTAPMYVCSNTDDLVVERDYLRGSGNGFESYPSIMNGARVRYNTLTVADLHDAGTLMGLASVTNECLFENNLFEAGGRGKTGGAYGDRTGFKHDLWLHNTFRGLWKGDGENMMYETGGGLWHGQVAEVRGQTVVAAGAPGWKPNDLKGALVFLTAGPGIGQFRTVVSNDATSVTLDRPWLVAPDTTSTFGVYSGVVTECLHLGNELYHCHYYSGIFGSGVRNVWVNDIFEDVTGGLFLWAISGQRVMFENLMYAEKFNERAGIVFVNYRYTDAKADPEKAQELAVLKMFGNEVRSCSVRERSYVASQNGMIEGGVMKGNWASKGVSSPITPVPGTEAGIVFFDEPPYWGGVPTDPLLDAYPASTRWNLVADNQIVRCPVGIELGKAVDHTILYNNTFYETPLPIQDLARNTLNLGSFVAMGGKPVPAVPPTP